MIVALYRVPGAAALNRRDKDPLDQLWQRLGTMYGPVLTGRANAQKVVATHHRAPLSRRQERDRT